MFRVILFQISARALLCKTAHFVLLLLHMPVHLGVSDIYTSSALSDLNSWRDLEDSREEKNIGGKRMLGKRPRPPLMNRTRSMSQRGHSWDLQISPSNPNKSQIPLFFIWGLELEVVTVFLISP